MSMTLDGFHHRMVRTGDVNIHAVIGGDGPPLVLLHGFPQTWWEWHKIMPSLAARRTVIAIDYAGRAIRIALKAATIRQLSQETFTV